MNATPVSADLTRLTATELGAAYGNGTADPLAVLDACIAAIRARDGDIRAFIELDVERARAAAKASTARFRDGCPLGPLDGVPVAVKANIAVRGLAWSAGVGYWRNRIAAADAPAVARLRAAGAVILGTLNMHEGALGATTDNPHFGRCCNPAVPGCTPGGSSGGSGAAVAAGFVPVALGTDTMGSVRIPAAYCGVMGLKPTTGLVSNAGVVPLAWSLDHIGPVARSVDDLALVTRVLAGFDPADPVAEPAPAGWTAMPGGRGLAGMRLGLPREIDAVETEPAVREAFARALDRLRDLGATIQPVAIPGWSPGRARRDGLLISEAEAAELHPELMGPDGTTTPQGVSESFAAALRYGRDASAARLAGAYRRTAEIGVAARAALAGLDAFILPTAPQTAFAHDAPVPAGQADFTALANFAKLPAVSVPVEPIKFANFANDTTFTNVANSANLANPPIGLQFIGPRFGEAAILRMAAAWTSALNQPG